jgi:hypothetical protein
MFLFKYKHRDATYEVYGGDQSDAYDKLLTLAGMKLTDVLPAKEFTLVSVKEVFPIPKPPKL